MIDPMQSSSTKTKWKIYIDLLVEIAIQEGIADFHLIDPFTAKGTLSSR